MTKRSRSGVFFACDTGSGAFRELREGLEHLLESLQLDIVVFNQEANSDDGQLEKVERLIAHSLCLVADAGADPNRPMSNNVSMEIGLARGLGRSILLIANDPERLPSNVRGQDVVKYPECLRVGSTENKRLASFFEALGRGLLGGMDTKIFHSRSADYIEILKRIDELPGDEWYRAPEFRSFFRPLSTETRWLHEARSVSQALIEREQKIRADRRKAFEFNLGKYACVDIYPIEAMDLKGWRGMALNPEERDGFLAEAISYLERFPSYELIFTDEKDIQKFWIKDSPICKFVVFEGWGFVDIRREKEVGGVIMTEPANVAAFKSEVRKLIEKKMYSRAETINLLRSQRGEN